MVLCPFACDVFVMYWPRTPPLAPSVGTLKDGTLKKVTQDQVDAYNPLCHELPFTAEDFKLYLEGKPAHLWNKAATKVFVGSFCTKYPYYPASKVDVTSRSTLKH